MRLFPQSLGANGSSPWMIPGPLMIESSVSLALTFSYNANLTAVVQYTYDDPAQTPGPVTYARAGTVLTVTYPNHGLNVGDTSDLTSVLGTWGSTNAPANYDVATVVDANNFTVTVPNAGPNVDTGTARIYKLFVQSTVQGSGSPPARIDGFLDDGLVAAFRLKVSAWVAGVATLTATTTKGV